MVYKSAVDDVGVRGRPTIKWKSRVLKYLKESWNKGLREMGSTRMECMDRNKWRHFCRGHPLRKSPETGVRVDDIRLDQIRSYYYYYYYYYY